MKKSLSILLFVLINITSNAQFDLEWVKTLKNTQPLTTNKGIETRVIEAGTNNDVYIAGWFNGTMDFDPSPVNYFLTPLYNYSGFIAKYNSSGSLIWVKQLDEITGNGGITINDLIIDSNENIVVTGSFCCGIIDFNPTSINYNDTTSNSKMFTAKYNLNGEFLWEKSINSPTSSKGNELFIDNLNYIYIGYTFGLTPGIIKYDQNGNELWQKKFTGANAYGSTYVNLNGEIFVTGRGTNVDMDLSPTTNILTGNSIIYIGRYDNNAILIWAKKLNTSILQTTITSDSDKNVYTAGASSLVTATNNNKIICKWDSIGNLLWINSFPANTSGISTINKITINCAENILINGIYKPYSNNFDLLGGSYSITTPLINGTTGDYSYYLACYNKNDATILWAKGLNGEFWPSPGFDGEHISEFIDMKKSDNFYAISTYVASSDVDPNSTTSIINPGANNNFNDVFFAKYSGCNSIGLGELENNKLSNVFPNPNNGVFTISNLKPNVLIEILDLAGRSIYKTQVKNEKITFQLNDLEKGIYIYTITDKQGYLQSGKVILQ
jgi:hypothetical protein